MTRSSTINTHPKATQHLYFCYIHSRLFLQAKDPHSKTNKNWLHRASSKLLSCGVRQLKRLMRERRDEETSSRRRAVELSTTQMSPATSDLAKRNKQDLFLLLVSETSFHGSAFLYNKEE